MVDDLTRRRWDSTIDPAKVKPLDALRITIDDIERGVLDPRHIVILVDDKADDCVLIRQCGERDFTGVIGMFERGKAGYMERDDE